MKAYFVVRDGRLLVKMKYRCGLFIGRFQPFHLGHSEAILKLFEEMDEIIIIIGSAQLSHDIDNPFTAGERYVMIKDALHEIRVKPEKYDLIPVPDSPTHSVWVAQIISYSPPFDVVCSNDPLTRRLFKELDVPVERIPFVKRETLSATLVRRRMLSGEDWRELVPKSVVKDIERIGGVTRLRELAETDSPFGRGNSFKTLQ
jgi:nicotinamide-nucleotide adenylyltransferase